MITKQLSQVKKLISSTYQMFSLVWQAHPTALVCLVLLQFVLGLFPLGTAWINKEIFDLLAQSLTNSTDANFIRAFSPLLILQVFLSMSNNMISPVNQYLKDELGRKLQLKTQSMLYKQIALLDGLIYFENPQFHDTIRLATQGVQSGPSRVLDTVIQIIRSSITLVSFIGVLIFLNPFLACLILIVSMPQLIAQLKMGNQRYKLFFSNSLKERQMFYIGHILTDISFVKELRLFNSSDFFIKKFVTLLRDLQQSQRHQQLREMSWQFGLDMLSALSTSLAFVLVIRTAFLGQLTLGDVTLYTSAFSSVQGGLMTIIFALAQLNENALFFTHFSNLMALPPAIQAKQPLHSISSLQSGIEFKNVWFRYSEQHPWVLQNVNLFLPHKKSVALVGLNGAGKTSLVKLLMRLYEPTKGQILWDGIDIRHFDPLELRQQIGAIFQDFSRYDLTAQENIGLGNVDKIDDLPQIIHAAETVGIHDWLMSLPRGYQTVLSRWLADDAGLDLSGGQWQKVAIARMFMRNATLLILDEPTAALDAKSEYELFQQFADLTTQQTCLVISHRFSTVKMADTIAVLEGGKIVELGSHQELVALGQTYSCLYSMQASQYE